MEHPEILSIMSESRKYIILYKKDIRNKSPLFKGNTLYNVAKGEN